MILGADPQQLDQLAQRIHRRADEYEHADREIVRWLKRLDWVGPDAERFRSTYRSSMGPQIRDAAQALREAASELRVQAEDQRKTSADPYAQMEKAKGILERVLSVLGTAGQILFFTHPVVGIPVLLGHGLEALSRVPADQILHDVTNVLLKTDDVLTGFNALEVVSLIKNAGSVNVGEALPAIGAAKWLGSGAGWVLSAAGVGLAGFNLPFEVMDLSEAIGNYEWDDVESAQQLAWETADMVMTLGALVAPFTGPFAPVVAGGALVFGGTLKLGSMAYPWLIDDAAPWVAENLLWPAGQFISDKAEQMGELVVDSIQETYSFLVDDLPEVLGEGFEFAGDVVQGGFEFAGDVVQEGFEFAGDVVQEGFEFAGDVVEEGFEFAGDVAGAAGRLVGGWFD